MTCSNKIRQKQLEALAADCGWREVQAAEASEMGFAELVDWSVADTIEK